LSKTSFGAILRDGLEGSVKARLIVPLLALGLLSACATAPEPARLACDRSVTVTTQGTTLALRASAPARLQKASFIETGGGAVLSCRPAKGKLKSCQVLFEDQPGYGKAALGYAARVIYPTEEDSRTVEVRVRFSSAAATRCG
jgi:hypothetical protein